MKDILLIISLICSLSFAGCSDEQKTNKQVNDLPKQKVEQKIEKEKTIKTDNPKKEEKQKTEEPKRETDPQSDEELKKRVSERVIVIGHCFKCDKVLNSKDAYKDSQYGLVCIDCYNNSYGKCVRCGKTVNPYDEDTATGSSGLVCGECDSESIQIEHLCPGCNCEMTEINGVYCCLNSNCFRYNNPYDKNDDHYDLPSED